MSGIDDASGQTSVQQLAEAAVWVARLHGQRRDRAMEQALRHWLQLHPGNAPAFEQVTQVWEESQALQRLLYLPPGWLHVRRCLLRAALVLGLAGVAVALCQRIAVLIVQDMH